MIIVQLSLSGTPVAVNDIFFRNVWIKQLRKGPLVLFFPSVKTCKGVWCGSPISTICGMRAHVRTSFVPSRPWCLLWNWISARRVHMSGWHCWMMLNAILLPPNFRSNTIQEFKLFQSAQESMWDHESKRQNESVCFELSWILIKIWADSKVFQSARESPRAY